MNVITSIIWALVLVLIIFGLIYWYWTHKSHKWGHGAVVKHEESQISNGLNPVPVLIPVSLPVVEAPVSQPAEVVVESTNTLVEDEGDVPIHANVPIVRVRSPHKHLMSDMVEDSRMAVSDLVDTVGRITETPFDLAFGRPRRHRRHHRHYDEPRHAEDDYVADLDEMSHMHNY